MDDSQQVPIEERIQIVRNKRDQLRRKGYDAQVSLVAQRAATPDNADSLRQIEKTRDQAYAAARALTEELEALEADQEEDE